LDRRPAAILAAKVLHPSPVWVFHPLATSSGAVDPSISQIPPSLKRRSLKPSHLETRRYLRPWPEMETAWPTQEAGRTREEGGKEAKKQSATTQNTRLPFSAHPASPPRKNKHVITGRQCHCEVSVIAIKYPARTRRHTRTVRAIRILPRPSLEHFFSGPSSNGSKARNPVTLESPIERRHFIYLSQERNWESLPGRPTAAAGRRGQRGRRGQTGWRG
jgi:hypothetical protein